MQRRQCGLQMRLTGGRSVYQAHGIDLARASVDILVESVYEQELYRCLRNGEDT